MITIPISIEEGAELDKFHQIAVTSSPHPPTTPVRIFLSRFSFEQLLYRV